jgi:disulfide bond formation protein DsbB
MMKRWTKPNTPYLSFLSLGLSSANLPAILGLQVPEWSLLWFTILLAILLFTLFRKASH